MQSANRLVIDLSAVDEEVDLGIMSNAVPATPRRLASVADSQFSEVAESPGRRAAKARLMKMFLPRLFTATVELQTHLFNYVDDEGWHLEHQSFGLAFNTYKDNYVSSGDEYIIQDAVLNRLGAPAGTSSFHTMSKVLTAANITALLDEITFHRNEQQLLLVLQRLDQVFPLHFMPIRKPGQPEWMPMDESFEQALRIRTQLLVATLRKFQGEDYDHFTFVGNIFCADGSVNHDLQEILFDNEASLKFRPMAAIDLNEPHMGGFRELYLGRLRDICAILLADNDSTYLMQLEDQYPFDSFIDGLKGWLNSSFAKIRASTHPQKTATSLASFEEPRSSGFQPESSLRSGVDIQSTDDINMYVNPLSVIPITN
jgi:hypothetical protein